MTARLLPYNLDAEQNCIGCMLLDQEAACLGMEMLEPGHFYRLEHQAIFESICRIYNRDGQVDITTITDDLKSHKALEKAGDTEYLFACVESVPTAANMKYYAEIVVGMAVRRQIISACRQGADAAYDLECEDPCGEMMRLALEVHTPKNAEAKTLGPVLHEAVSEFEKIQNGETLGIPYGIPHLDSLVHGAAQTAELTLIGGRPSSGKTVLLLMLALQAAKAGLRVIFYSQETSAKKLAMRMIKNAAQVDESKFRRDKGYQEQAWPRIVEACSSLYAYDEMFLTCDMPINITAMRAQSKRLALKYRNTGRPVGLILVDYLQIVGPAKRCADRNSEVQTIAQGLHNMTMELKIPVAAASQLSRADGQPSLRHLREGGNQEAEADKVILIDNPPAETGQPMRPAVLTVAKNKDGSVGSVHAAFDGAHMRFCPAD